MMIRNKKKIDKLTDRLTSRAKLQLQLSISEIDDNKSQNQRLNQQQQQSFAFTPRQLQKYRKHYQDNNSFNVQQLNQVNVKKNKQVELKLMQKQVSPGIHTKKTHPKNSPTESVSYNNHILQTKDQEQNPKQLRLLKTQPKDNKPQKLEETKKTKDKKDKQYSSRNTFRRSHTIKFFYSFKNTRDNEIASAIEALKKSLIPSKHFKMTTNDSASLLESIIIPPDQLIQLASDLFVTTLSGPNQEDKRYCLLCSTRVKQTTINHLNDNGHKTVFTRLKREILNKIPHPDSIQMLSLYSYLDSVYSQEIQALTEERLHFTFETIRSDLEQIMQYFDKDIVLNFVGLKHMGITSSNVDITLELTYRTGTPMKKQAFVDSDVREQNTTLTMYKFAKDLLDPCRYNQHLELKSEFSELNSKIPRLLLAYSGHGFVENVEIVYNEGGELNFYKLLEKYLAVDSRVGMLIICLKYWAQTCKLDDGEAGTFSNQALIVLILYFLQTTSPPVLPVFKRRSKTRKARDSTSISEKVEKEGIETTLTSNLGKLHIDLNDNNCKHANETNGESIISKLKQNDLMVSGNRSDTDHSSDKDKEEDKDNNDDEEENNFSEENESLSSSSELQEDDKNTFRTDNHSTIPELFLEFLLEIGKIFSDNESIFISINGRTTPPTINGHKIRGRVFIEDPFKPKSNLGKGIVQIRSLNYIRTCFLRSFYFFSSIPLDSNELRKNIKNDGIDYPRIFVDLLKFEVFCRMRTQLLDKGNQVKESMNDLLSMVYVDGEAIRSLLSSATADNFLYLLNNIVRNYDTNLLIPEDQEGASFCFLCRTFGHSKLECSKNLVKHLFDEQQNYNYELDAMADFDSEILAYYSRNKIAPFMMQRYNNILEMIESFINSKCDSRCKLTLYGSTVNGLGSIGSDLDICMTIEGNPTGEGLDFNKILRKVFKHLRKFKFIPNYRAIEGIFQARVPIIKFYIDYLNERYDIDLSMYNMCAMYNSRMLKAYSAIDERFPQLYSMVKLFAKSCELADAPRGTLSSYAWSLLCIHFLQHTNPPILPVLQDPKLARLEVKPNLHLNSWNVWFYGVEDENFVYNKRSIGMKQNISRLTTLYKEFMIYYANFDFDMHVVSIRQFELMNRFEKGWSSGTRIAIEDPFELNWNLASRLDVSLSLYIRNIFSAAYNQTESLQKTFVYNQDYGRSRDYLMRILDGTLITNSNPPPLPAIKCRSCKRVGHFIRECPNRVPLTRSPRKPGLPFGQVPQGNPEQDQNLYQSQTQIRLKDNGINANNSIRVAGIMSNKNGRIRYQASMSSNRPGQQEIN